MSAALVFLTLVLGCGSEERQTFSGRLQIVKLEDSAGRGERTEYVVEDGRNAYTLRLPSSPPTWFEPGVPVTVRGVVRDTEIEVDEIARSSTAFTFLKAVDTSAKVAVLLINFADANNYVTPAQVQDIVFTGDKSVSKLYNESSFGQFAMTGDVFGPYTISIHRFTANAWQIAFAGENAATQAGVKLDNYPYRIYVVVPNGGTASGEAPIGGKRAWVYAATYPSVYAHEFGHSLGMNHAASNDGAEYGDWTDPMSNTNYLGHFNGPHKVGMGWIPPSRIQTVTTSGTYSLAPLELPTTKTQIVKINKPDTHDDYYISYRRVVGFDDYYSVPWGASVSIHRWGLPLSTMTYFLGPIRSGVPYASDTYKDSVNHLTVTVDSMEDDVAKVSITFNAP